MGEIIPEGYMLVLVDQFDVNHLSHTAHHGFWDEQPDRFELVYTGDPEFEIDEYDPPSGDSCFGLEIITYMPKLSIIGMCRSGANPLTLPVFREAALFYGIWRKTPIPAMSFGSVQVENGRKITKK